MVSGGASRETRWGKVPLRRADPAPDLFTRIDAMPMRRREMRKKRRD